MNPNETSRVQVRCSGKMHSIELLADGQLRFVHHSDDELQAAIAGEALGAEPCRCADIYAILKQIPLPKDRSASLPKRIMEHLPKSGRLYVTMGRKGSATWKKGAVWGPLYAVKVYTVMRNRRGKATWRLQRTVGSFTGRAACAKAAKEYAERVGLPYAPGIISGLEAKDDNTDMLVNAHNARIVHAAAIHHPV
jgi:hypothetical protein